MGNCVSIELNCTEIVTQSCNCVADQTRCVCELEKNLKALSIELEELKELRNDVVRRVNVDEKEQLKRLDQVQGWFSRVESAIAEAEELTRNGPEEIARLSFGGCWSKNCKHSYKFGKRVAEKLKDITCLKVKGGFEVVLGRVPANQMEERPNEPTVGLEPAFNKIWSCLGDAEVGIVGIYGMGGVGKTTLLKQINNEFIRASNDFNLVMWVVVSKDHKTQKLQEAIGEKLGIVSDLWKDQDLDKRAADIFRALSKRKFVLLLDDLWERVDLIKVGIPIPSKENGSKVVFTTRSMEVCGRMEARKKIKVECLPWEESWDLFCKKVGEETLAMHSDIPELAKDVARECKGLPLALITIGRAMACKETPQEWSYAIMVLRKSAAEFSGMEDEVFPILKFSYDSLANDMLKRCFLYWSLFPEDGLIKKSDLIELWYGEEFLDNFDDYSGTQNQGYDIIGTLCHACLVEEEGIYVKMHDVIRDMALWIANDCGQKYDNYFVQAGTHLKVAPNPEKWQGVERMSLMRNDIKSLSETPVCPTMLTLFLNSNSLRMISRDFFNFMRSLTVLSISENYSLKELPSSVSNLVSLEYLNLSNTGIIRLPIELQALTKLKFLNLERAYELDTIPRELITLISRLQVLRMIDCGSHENEVAENILSDSSESSGQDCRPWDQLIRLTITIKTASTLRKFSSSEKLRSCTQVLQLKHYRMAKLLSIMSFSNMSKLEKLLITDCDDLREVKISQEARGGTGKAPHDGLLNFAVITQCQFSSLRKVYVSHCLELEELTWLVLAPNLEFLRVTGCLKLEQVVCAEKLGEMANNVKPFAKLEKLILESLPFLKSIYSSALPFPFFKDLTVLSCPALKKLPFDSHGSKEGKLIIQGTQEWWNGLKWGIWPLKWPTKTASRLCVGSVEFYFMSLGIDWIFQSLLSFVFCSVYSASCIMTRFIGVRTSFCSSSCIIQCQNTPLVCFGWE